IAVRRVKPVALWSGVLPASREWRTIELDVPEFDGALRIMAVASGDGKFGSAERTTRVHDPIVLTPSLPRFLAPGDELEIPVAVYHGLGEAAPDTAAITVRAELDGPIRVAAGAESLSVAVAAGKEAVVVFGARAADSVGRAVVTLTGEAGGERAFVTTELSVRPPRPLETLARSGVLRAGEIATVPLWTDFFGGTQRVRIAVSALPVGQVAAALSYLLTYPYGCVEQTVSRCIPLLYFPEIAREVAPEAFGAEDALYFLNSGLDRILAMHIRGGGFSTWPGGTIADANPWATVYATHFLVEARKKDLVVPDRVLDDALEHLAKLARSPEGPGFDGWSAATLRSVRAYAAYVLALAGRPEKAVMERLRLADLEEMRLAARYHLAGAYGLTGNRAQMEDLLPATVADAPEERDTGFTFSSQARDGAVMLDVLATAAPDHRHVAALLEKLLGGAENGRWHNTQENGWALLALGKVIARLGGGDIAGEVRLGGEVLGAFGAEGIALEGGDAWAGGTVEIRTSGPGAAYWSVAHEGVPHGIDERDVTNGLVVSREYFTLSGEPLDVRSIPQGEVIVARLVLASTSGQVRNIVVADVVPAGLEIENPRLAERNLIPWSVRRPSLPVEYLDIRDDRLLLFTRADSTEREYYYTLRAVTRGRFALPPVKAEAMYDPAIVSVRGAGEIRVVAAD
ncbi:MAG: alpha-2-macroglobulin family protein, partial [bacterium]